MLLEQNRITLTAPKLQNLKVTPYEYIKDIGKKKK